MAVKVLAISASPRKDGNSDVLCEQFLKGASEVGNEVEKISLRQMNITPCIACYGCSKSHKCVKEDDMHNILQKLIGADVIVLATPVYFYSMDAQMKTMIDRCLPRYQEIRDKDFYYIVTAAEPQHSAADETISGLRGYLRCLPGATKKGIIYGTGVWKVGEIEGKPVLKEAYEIGEKI